MNILQNGQKIGYSRSTVSKKENGYGLHESVFLRINTMGLTQDLTLKTQGILNADFTLVSFEFSLNSGRFSFSASGEVSGDQLTVKMQTPESTQQSRIKLDSKPVLSAGLLPAIVRSGIQPGRSFQLNVFDPATLGQQTVIVKYMGKETILNMGVMKDATKVSVEMKGMTQFAWIDEDGEVLKESGLLGITLEKTSPPEALADLTLDAAKGVTPDMTQAASVKSNVALANPNRLQSLKIRLEGIDVNSLQVNGGRQKLAGDILSIEKESLANLKGEAPLPENDFGETEKTFLAPSAFIESDHPEIVAMIGKILSPRDSPLTKVEKIVAWIQENIRRQPVLSIPDALLTLQNRAGDCNEHAVLLAALARAAGIPATVEAGLVYMEGKFYYHAWNSVFVGQWVTVDSLFNQIPSDVTHIRFAGGTPQQQLDLIGVIGKVKIEVLEYR